MKTTQLIFLLLNIYLSPIFATTQDHHSNHMAVIEGLIGNQDITHTAISDANWFDSNIWSAGAIPNIDLSPGLFNLNINSGVYEYLSPATTAGAGLTWHGEKTDSVGFSPIPAGTDNIGVPVFDMIATLEEDGYYRTTTGVPYAVVEEYFTDRSSGIIHKIGLKTMLGPAVNDVLGNQFTAWAGAFQAGIIDLNSVAPVTQDDNYQVSSERLSQMTLLSNDSDPDGDQLAIDGIVQPLHGRVFAGQDGSVSYVSDYDYIGQDHFSYWVTDQQGNYTPARVNINVINDLIFINDFTE